MGEKSSYVTNKLPVIILCLYIHSVTLGLMQMLKNV